MAESTDSQIHEVSAGVSSTLAEQMENYTKQGTDLASGVTDVMSDYLLLPQQIWSVFQNPTVI